MTSLFDREVVNQPAVVYELPPYPPEKIDGIFTKHLINMDWDLYPNGISYDKFCPVHGRHGSVRRKDECICNSWYVCSCGSRSYGTCCGQCGQERRDGAKEVKNPYKEPWKKWVRMKFTHRLKTWKRFFAQLESGEKTFELREDDRGIKVGDVLEVVEVAALTRVETGRVLYRIVTHVLKNDDLQKISNEFLRYISDDPKNDPFVKLPRYMKDGIGYHMSIFSLRPVILMGKGK